MIHVNFAVKFPKQCCLPSIRIHGLQDQRRTLLETRCSGCGRTGARPTHLEVLGLLPELQHVLTVELAFPPVVVLYLVLQLSLVLQPDQVHAQLLQGLELPLLQLLGGLVVADQHGVLHLLLGLLLVELLNGGARRQR